MTNIYDTYLEAEVLGADPIKLVHMLYRGAAEAVSAARRHLAAREIRERSRQITKAWEILFELSKALDHHHGGDLSRRLSDLYTYMQRRLLEANSQQSDAPLAEVDSLLATLSNAWSTAKFPTPDPVEVEAYEPLSCVY